MAENGTVGQIHLGTIIFLHFLKVHFSYFADYRAEVLGVFLSTKPLWGEKTSISMLATMKNLHLE